MTERRTINIPDQLYSQLHKLKHPGQQRQDGSWDLRVDPAVIQHLRKAAHEGESLDETLQRLIAE